jgi:hypothetical protein
MPLLFLSLLEKMLRQLRQRLGRKMGRDRVILQLCAELVSDLFVNSVNNFLAREHGRPFLLDVFFVLAHQRATINAIVEELDVRRNTTH